jgi:hypothetical protein
MLTDEFDTFLPFRVFQIAGAPQSWRRPRCVRRNLCSDTIDGAIASEIMTVPTSGVSGWGNKVGAALLADNAFYGQRSLKRLNFCIGV